jgi:hypothetical protein
VTAKSRISNNPPVDWERDSEVGNSQREAVGKTAGLSRAEHAERDAECRRQEHCRARELKRLGKTLADVLCDGAIGDVRPTKSP